MSRFCSRASAWLRRLAEDEFRREVNARNADLDGAAWLFMTMCIPVVLWFKAGHDPSLLLLGGSAMLLAVGSWLLLRYRRDTYVSHREALLIISFFPAVMLGALQHSFTSHLQLHAGRSPRLLVLLLLAHPGTFALLGALYGRAVVAVNQCLLPATAVLAVLTGNQSTCRQLLAVPGVEQPLERLHSAASLCHTGALLPPVFAGMGHPMQPMQQCLALNAYLTGLIGAVLPLFMLSRMEAAERRRFYARRPRQWSAERSTQSGTQLEVQPMGWSSLFFCSFMVWLAADVAYSLPWGAAA